MALTNTEIQRRYRKRKRAGKTYQDELQVKIKKVMQLREKGVSITDIAKIMDISRNTCKRYIEQGTQQQEGGSKMKAAQEVIIDSQGIIDNEAMENYRRDAEEACDLYNETLNQGKPIVELVPEESNGFILDGPGIMVTEVSGQDWKDLVNDVVL